MTVIELKLSNLVDGALKLFKFNNFTESLRTNRLRKLLSVFQKQHNSNYQCSRFD